MPSHLGPTFKQEINHAELYFTHYALFEEPDTGVPNAVYIDAATGAPTQELILTPPINERTWTRAHPDRHDITAPTETSKLLPYFVSPPGFPPEPPPPQIVQTIAGLTGVPEATVQANTVVLLVAIGQFIADGTTTGKIQHPHFEVTKSMRFQVRIRTGFIFTPPGGAGQAMAILTGYLDMGTLHQLIGLPPPPNPTDIVLYDWKAPITLTTETEYKRKVATEPKPVADGFPPNLKEIHFQGQPLDANHQYTIVGHAKPADVQFTAPPELEQFLFGTTSLTDVEFAVLEKGVLKPV